ALIFGVDSFRIGGDKAQTLRFTPDIEETRAKLKGLAAVHPAAADVLRHDATLNGSLLLRHQLAHSLAPMIDPVSLTLYEVGVLRRGGAEWYEVRHLPPKGLVQQNALSADALLARSRQQAATGLRALLGAIDAVAVLSIAIGQLEPPRIVWYVVEESRSY